MIYSGARNLVKPLEIMYISTKPQTKMWYILKKKDNKEDKKEENIRGKQSTLFQLHELIDTHKCRQGRE